MAESITECDHTLKFEKRPGTEDDGHTYEVYLTALFAIKLALDDAVHDVRMASNVDKYGAFDDIVARVQYKNGATVLYLIQLKHKKKPQTPVDFINKTNGDFSLEKYKNSYYKDIKERISEDKLDDLLKGVKIKDVFCCLFTNAISPKATNKIIIDKRASLSCKALDCTGIDFLETTPAGYKSFQMYTERPEFGEFVTSYFFSDYYQRGFEDRIKKLKEKSPNLEASRAKKIGKFFRDKVKTEIISKNEEINPDTILARVDESTRESLKEVDSDFLEEILNELINYYRVEYQFAENAYEEYSSKCEEYSEFFQRFRFYGGQLNCKQVKAAIALRIEESLGKCKPEVVTKFIEYVQDYFQGNCLLVKRQIQKRLLELMVPSKGNFERRFQVFQVVTDLNNPEQKLLLSKHIKVALQGRRETRLCDIVDSDFCQSLTPEFLLNHMGDVIHIGRNLEFQCENYIKREFRKFYLVLSSSAFTKCANSIFIVSVSKTWNLLDELDDWQEQKVNIIDLRNGQNLPNDFSSNSKTYVILILNEGDVDDRVETLMIESISAKANAVHYLNEIGGGLEWKGSRHRTSSASHTNFQIPLRRMIDKENIKEEELLQYFKSTPVNIVSAEPGMGKSTVLDSLIRYCPSNKWVLKLNLNEWSNDLRKKFQEILEDPLQYMFEKSEEVCKKEFSRNLFSYMKSRKAAMVFIDAFDEISPKYTDVVLKLIRKLEHLGICTWVFSRPNLEENLTQNFNTAAIKILPLKEDEIKHYLLKNIRANNKSYLERLLQEMIDFLKIPLHLYMLSTILCSETLNWNNLEVTDLYEIFINIKCDIYYKKFNIDRERNHVDVCVPSNECLIDKHQLLSLRLFVDEDVLVQCEVASHSDFEQLLSEIKEYQNHFGLITGVLEYPEFPEIHSSVIFCHRTFAEFLSARWLSKNVHHRGFKYICEYLSPDNCVINWFKKIIAPKYPLHVAVADRNLKLVRQLCNETRLVLCDGLKRTPLHLAMNYFQHKRLYNEMDEELSVSKDDEVACNILNEICENFADTKSFLTHKDIFDFSWHEFVVSCENIFLCSCYWGHKAVLMMCLASNYFLEVHRNNVCRGIKYLSQRGHIGCLRLLLVCDVFGGLEQMKSHLGLPSLPEPQINEYLWENFESELVYALKFFIASDSPYKSDPRFEQRFYNRRIFNKLLEDTKKKFITGSDNDLEALEERLNLASIRENLNILERVEMVTKIQLSDCTPLCAAAFCGYLNSVKVMAANSGTLNANPEDKFVLLYYAIDGGDVEVITWLIETGTDVNQLDPNGNVALNRLYRQSLLLIDFYDLPFSEEFKTMRKNKLDTMKLLLDKGADATIKNHKGVSCFELALDKHDLRVIKLFVDSGIHVDYRSNENDFTALYDAIKLNHLEYVKYFLSKGANVNIKVYENTKTSLDIAFDTNFINWQIVKLLVERDADVIATQNVKALAPLIGAVEKNHLEVAQYLVNKQLDVTITTDVSELSSLFSINSLFILASAKSETCNYIRELLMKHGKYSTATLFTYCLEERRTIFRIILDERYTSEISTYEVFFERAVEMEIWEFVKIFIEYGVNVDQRFGDYKCTALHKAVKADRLDYVKYFIDQQADVNLTVCEKTSLDLALENERVNWEMVWFLVGSGASAVNLTVQDRLELVKFLFNKEDDASITDGSDSTISNVTSASYQFTRCIRWCRIFCCCACLKFLTGMRKNTEGKLV